MAEARLRTLLGPPSEKSLAPSVGKKVLTLLQDSRLPRPDLVLQLGSIVLSRLSETGREYWDITAQLCAAASELGEYEIMDSLFARIIARFPHSARSFVLLGGAHEAKSRWSEAMDTYITVIKEDQMVPAVYKRQVAVLKSEMKLPEAVSLLNYYISLYSGDVDGWAELCSLCLSLGRLSHALFAASELVMNDPGNHAFQTLAADVYMTCGGKENVIKAREHYACSLIARKQGNLRALYGMWLACSKLLDNGLLKNEDEITRNDKLLGTAKAGIAAVYGKLHREGGTSSVGSAALVVINSNIVTGRDRYRGKA